MKTNLEKGDKFTHLFIKAIEGGVYSKVDASDMLGISRPTLDKRIETDMWKKLEKQCIKTVLS